MPDSPMKVKRNMTLKYPSKSITYVLPNAKNPTFGRVIC